MRQEEILIDYAGIYGGPASRDEILRALKEALALVEQTAQGAQLSCAGLRIVLVLHEPDGSETGLKSS